MNSEELTGRTLGDFIVRHRIGEGGFGAVYRAEQPLLGREAVIKVLHSRHRTSKTVLQRFLREARLASKLDHPYAAHIYAFGVETDNLMWIAMEYVRGQTLHELLRSKGPMALEELVPLLDRICEVLQAAHDLGIVHRDIKPPNVMVVQRSGRMFPKLLDFGIAKLSVEEHAIELPTPPTPAPAPTPSPTEPFAMTTSMRKKQQALDAQTSPTDGTVSFVGQPGGMVGGALARPKRESGGLAPTLQAAAAQAISSSTDEEPALTEAGAAVGSPPYMAPEQWDDSAAATARTDLYALGVMTYEALVGRRPFGGANVMAMAMAHAISPIPEVGGSHPIALDEVFTKVLAKKAGDRYASAMEFAQAFRSAAGFGTSQPLPDLDEELRISIEASFPQPIAEAVAAFHAARNPHQGRDALREIVASSIRYVTMIALATQAQVRITEAGSTAAIAELFRELRRRALRDEEWLELAKKLVAAFVSRPQAHPMPELVALLQQDTLATVVQPRAGDPDPLHAIQELLPDVTRMLRALTFLADYPLVVVAEGRAESWMGVRRPRRVGLEIHGRVIEAGQPVLVDATGRPIVALWPVVQTSSPMPGAAPELFMLDGKGRRGARLVAMPGTLERQDEHVWDWLSERFSERDRDTPVSSDNHDAPYRGLASFTTQDADAFVGREREVDAAINRLKTSSLVAVVGSSGAGKSSFVHAGILPSLPAGWTTISVRPGATPLAALEVRLRRAGLVVPNLAASLANDPAALGEIFQARANVTTVLVIDQFEELFTLGAPVEERRVYVRALLAAAQSPEDKVRIVITLRDDFLARALQMPELRDRLPTSLFLLGTPVRTELVRILTQPLARLGFDFDDPTLPERMVDDVAETPGALALLSFTASKLWELRDRHFRQLTRKAYDSLGGVVGALAQHAEATLAELSSSEQRLARTALGHLVTADGTRAILSRSELDQLLRDSAASTVVEKLVTARLLTATESEGGDDSIEIIHEALVVAWPRLAEWRREDAEGARLRDQVRAASRQWVERGKPSGLLWRDDALVELQVWRARHPQPLIAAEEAFVSASLDEAKRGRRLRRGVTVGVLALMAIAVAVLIWANQRTARERVVAEQERSHAQALASSAEQQLTKQYYETGRNLFLSGDAPRAMAYLGEAFQRGVDTPAMRYLLAAASAPIRSEKLVLRGHTDKVSLVRWSKDGTKLASASSDHTARIWSSDGHLLTTLKLDGSVFTAVFDSTATRVITTSQDDGVRIYSITGQLERKLATKVTATTASFSPDDSRIAAATARGSYIWDATTGEEIARLDTGITNTLEFSQDGQRITTAGESLRIYDAHTGKELGKLVGHDGFVTSASFSHDGKYVVSTSIDGTTRLWELATMKALATLHGDGIASAATFSPDDRTVTAVSDGGPARMWSVPDGELRLTLDGHTTGTTTVAYAPHGDRLATGGGDGRAVLWDAKIGVPIATMPGHTGTLSSIAFSPDDTTIATGSYDGTVRIWTPVVTPLVAALPVTEDLSDAKISPDAKLVATSTADQNVLIWRSTGELVHTLAAHKPAATKSPIGDNPRLRFRSDGHVLVSGGSDGQLIAWDPEAGTEIARAATETEIETVEISVSGLVAFGTVTGKVGLWTIGGALRWLPSSGVKEIRSVRFSPDGELVVGGSDDHLLRMWRVSDATLLGTVDVGARIWDIAFAPDQRSLVVGHDAAATIIDVSTLKPGFVLHHNGYVEIVSFRPDGKQIVTASEDGTAALWNVATGKREVSLTGHGRVVFAAAYDPTGRFVVTGGSDRLVRLWDSTTGELLHILHGHSIGAFSAQQVDGMFITGGLDRRVCVWRLVLDSGFDRTSLAAFMRCHLAWKLENGELVEQATSCAEPARSTMPK